MADSDEEVGGDSLPLRTITGLWLFPRYLHMLGKINLSSFFGPVSLKFLQFTAVTVTPIWVALTVFNVPWSGPAIFFRITLPVFIVWAGLKLAADGQSVRSVAVSVAWWWVSTARQLGALAWYGRSVGGVVSGSTRVRVARPRQVPVGPTATERVVAPEGFAPTWELDTFGWVDEEEVHGGPNGGGAGGGRVAGARGRTAALAARARAARDAWRGAAGELAGGHRPS